MLTVAPDRDLVERQLGNGVLVCPRCEAGVLGGHGWVGRGGCAGPMAGWCC